MKKILSILLAALLLGSIGVVSALAADTYMVKYLPGENNDGTVNLGSLPADGLKTPGADYIISLTIPTRTDYKFKGWVTAEGQTVYQPGATYKGDNLVPLEFYAQWEYDVVKVTFDGNAPAGGSVTGVNAGPHQKTKLGSLAVSVGGTPVCTGADYKFIGWHTSKTGQQGTQGWHTPAGYFSGAEDATLYAVWTPYPYPVTYNLNGSGATNLPAMQEKEDDVTLVLNPDAAPKRTYYTFLGWSEIATATTKQYSPGDDYKANKAITLYAVWKGYGYTVKYDANGGSGTMADSTGFVYGTPKALSANAFTYGTTGAFQGWALSKADADAGKVNYANLQSVSIPPVVKDAQGNNVPTDGATITLYAVWKFSNQTNLAYEITEAEKLDGSKYTAATWNKLAAALAKAKAVAANAEEDLKADLAAKKPPVPIDATTVNAATIQNHIDNAAHALALARRDLVAKKTIFTTKYESNFQNWLMFIFLFGFIWMWFVK